MQEPFTTRSTAHMTRHCSRGVLCASSAITAGITSRFVMQVRDDDNLERDTKFASKVNLAFVVSIRLR